MRISTETPNLMIIKDRSFFAFLVAAAFLFVGIWSFISPESFTTKPSLIPSILSILAGAVVIIFVKTTMIILDKSANKLSFIWKSLISEKTENYELNRVKAVELRQSFGDRRTYYKLVFIFDDNKEIPFIQQTTATNIGILVTKQRNTGIKVANFLNVPFQERRSSTINETFTEIRKTVEEEVQKYNK